MMYDPPPVLTRLRRQWQIFLLASLSFLAVMYVLLAVAWQPADALLWLILPSLNVAYLLVVLWRNLGANRRPGEETLLPALGWGNVLSLARGVLVAGMMGFLFLPRPTSWLGWIPGILYVLSDAADFLDGYVARRANYATRLGEILDMSLDGVGVLAACLLVVQYGQAPAWYVLVGLARYLFLAGLWLRKKLDLPVYDLPPDLSRRLFAGLQMGFLAVILLPLFSPPGTIIAATLFGLPFLAGFGRDWLYASGLLRAADNVPRAFQLLLSRWLPVLLRLSMLALQAGPIAAYLVEFPALPPFLVLIGLGNLLAVALLALGVMPRPAAILGLVVLGFYQALAPLSLPQIALAVIYTIILYMGGGALSLWKPEDYLYYHRAGERRERGAPAAGSGLLAEDQIANALAGQGR